MLFTLVQAARQAEPLKFPRPSAAAVSTALAWLLIAALVVYVAVIRRR